MLHMYIIAAKRIERRKKNNFLTPCRHFKINLNNIVILQNKQKPQEKKVYNATKSIYSFPIEYKRDIINWRAEST